MHLLNIFIKQFHFLVIELLSIIMLIIFIIKNEIITIMNFKPTFLPYYILKMLFFFMELEPVN